MSAKALGYGIDGGRLSGPWDEPVVVDLATADGEVLPASARPQIEPIAGLVANWSRFVTEDGRQLMTVGHHWSRSRPLNNDERAHTDRQGVCLACHREIPNESLAVSLLHHAAAYADALPKTNEQHARLIHKSILFAAWGQVGGAVVSVIVVLGGPAWFVIRRRQRRASANRSAGGEP